MRHLLVTLTVILMVGLLAAACAAPTQPPAAQEAPAADAAEAEPTPIVAQYGEGGVELTYSHGLTGADGVTMQKMVESFVKDNPDISVTIEAMPWNIYWDKLLTSMVSGSPPDVFIIHEFATSGFSSQGVLRDSADLYQSGGGSLPDDDFKPELLERLDWEGVRYGVPLDNLGWGTWVNRDLLEAAGFNPDEPPVDQTEFLSMVRQLTIDANGNNAESADFDPENVVQWGIAINNPKNTFQSVLWQFGGDVFDAEHAMLTEEPAQAAAKFLNDLIYVDHVSPPPGGFNALQAFGAGQLAIMPGGTWNLNFMLDSGINWGAWPMLTMGLEPATRMSSHVLHMPAGLEGEQLEAAKRLVYYLSDNGLTWAESGQVPARFSVQENLDPVVHKATIVFAEAFLDQGRLEVPRPPKSEIAEAWEPEINGMWDNVTPIEEALQTANERVQAVLDRNNIEQ